MEKYNNLDQLSHQATAIKRQYNNNQSSLSSLGTPSDDDTITMSTSDINTEVMTKSKFLNSSKQKRSRCDEFDLDSVESIESLESGESLLKHIQECRECKHKLIALIKQHRFNNKPPNEPEICIDSSLFSCRYKIKDILLCVIVVVLLLTVLDTIVRFFCAS